MLSNWLNGQRSRWCVWPRPSNSFQNFSSVKPSKTLPLHMCSFKRDHDTETLCCVYAGSGEKPRSDTSGAYNLSCVSLWVFNIAHNIFDQLDKFHLRSMTTASTQHLSFIKRFACHVRQRFFTSHDWDVLKEPRAVELLSVRTIMTLTYPNGFMREKCFLECLAIITGVVSVRLSESIQHIWVSEQRFPATMLLLRFKRITHAYILRFSSFLR